MNVASVWIHLPDGQRESTISPLQKVLITYDVGVDHQAAGATEQVAALPRAVMGNYNSMENCLLRIGQCDWESVSTVRVEEKTIRVLANPSLGTKHLNR